MYRLKLTLHLLIASLSLLSLCVLAQAEEALNNFYRACISLRVKSNPLCWVYPQGKASSTSQEIGVFANPKQHFPICTGSGKGDPVNTVPRVVPRVKCNPLCILAPQGTAGGAPQQTCVFPDPEYHLPVCTGSG